MSAGTKRASTIIDYVSGETQRLATEWAALTRKSPAFPMFTWEDLLEALLDQTRSELEELAIRGALGSLIKTSQFKTKELLLQDLLVLTASISELQHRRTTVVEEEVSMI